MSPPDELVDSGQDGAEMPHARRSDDYKQVEIAKLSNGAKRNALIQTIALIVSPIMIVLGLMWWGAKIDTGLDVTQAAVVETKRDLQTEIEIIRDDAEEAAEDRRRLAETQARISEALATTTTTLDRVNVRLDETRDDVLILKGAAGAQNE